MPKPSESITLYGEKAERFRKLRDDVLRDEFGFKPSNAETVGWLLTHAEHDILDESR